MTDAESLVRDLINKVAPEHDFGNYELNIKAINSGGANYTSVLFLVTVKRPGKKDVELFAKFACLGDKMREIMDANRMFYLEEFFYNKLAKIYNALEFKKNIADENRFAIPKFYGCNTKLYEETVVLENLVAKGYESYSRFISVDWEHAASSIENLAKFHALSFAYQKENPEEYEEVCKDLAFVEVEQDDQMKEVWEKNYVAKALGVVKDEYKSKILKLLEDMGEDGFWKLKRPLSKKVIIHGDYRPSNLLYKRQDNKVHAIVVDYQTIHIGTPAADLIYFELCGTDSKFRAEHHDRLVDHYYTELVAAMQRLGVDATEVYPREVFDSELKEMLPSLVTLGMFLLPVVLVEAEQAPKMDGDGGVETFAIPSSELYAERFAGVVEDCVRWGVI